MSLYAGYFAQFFALDPSGLASLNGFENRTDLKYVKNEKKYWNEEETDQTGI